MAYAIYYILHSLHMSGFFAPGANSERQATARALISKEHFRDYETIRGKLSGFSNPRAPQMLPSLWGFELLVATLWSLADKARLESQPGS